MNRSILISQKYSEKDDLIHIRNLIPAFKDPRYIRINGKPLFLVYRAESLPNPTRTAELWRQEVRKAGFRDVCLARVEGFERNKDPEQIGFDVAVEFAPDWRILKKNIYAATGSGFHAFWRKLKLALEGTSLVDYQDMVSYMLKKHGVPYKRFRCVAPSFDNSPRRSWGGAVFLDSSPEKYGKWLRNVLSETSIKFHGDEKIVFINAWNEWGEGCHLEPDERHGFSWLEATRLALQEC
jgi:hypothetical protein